MPFDVISNRTRTVAGVSLRSSKTIEVENIAGSSVTVPAAKVGELTTRTNGTEGELTMGAGHGIETADKLDIYWADGSRHQVTVGTVAGNAVPFTGGVGNDLPSAETPITACVPSVEACVFEGDNLHTIDMFASQRGAIVLLDDAGEIVEPRAISGPKGQYAWDDETGDPNPLAEASVAAVAFSNALSTKVALMHALFGHDGG